MPAAAARRPERGGDAPFLSALFAAAQGGPLAGLPPSLRDALVRQGAAGQDASFRAAHPGARFEVVERDGAPAGRLVTDLSAGTLTLLDIALLPEHRGLGLGTALLRALQGEARAAGVPLRLSALRGNAGALRLYARLGFAPAGGSETHIDMTWTP